MKKNVTDLTEYMPRGGYITASVPFIFNINDVEEIQKKFFEFEDDPDVTCVIRLTFKNGDHIALVYPDEETRDKNYTQLVVWKAKSKFRVLDGKSKK